MKRPHVWKCRPACVSHDILQELLLLNSNPAERKRLCLSTESTAGQKACQRQRPVLTPGGASSAGPRQVARGRHGDSCSLGALFYVSSNSAVALW